MCFVNKRKIILKKMLKILPRQVETSERPQLRNSNNQETLEYYKEVDGVLCCKSNISSKMYA